MPQPITTVMWSRCFFFFWSIKRTRPSSPEDESVRSLFGVSCQNFFVNQFSCFCCRFMSEADVKSWDFTSEHCTSFKAFIPLFFSHSHFLFQPHFYPFFPFSFFSFICFGFSSPPPPPPPSPLLFIISCLLLNCWLYGEARLYKELRGSFSEHDEGLSLCVFLFFFSFVFYLQRRKLMCLWFMVIL